MPSVILVLPEIYIERYFGAFLTSYRVANATRALPALDFGLSVWIFSAYKPVLSTSNDQISLNLDSAVIYINARWRVSSVL